MGAAIGGAALAIPFIARNGLAETPIKVGCLLDLSGALASMVSRCFRRRNMP
jgi:hypothetical protein